ncbi:SDR family oxidoreductase [Novosphingobium sp. G106]|uniref:SDR family oxidoreductase n=1 Tax=Novosphingobium sp. G106 TaxID=2849500 RepID=UPI001C2DC28C|nr:SDR family oxidoreductase [Novosphingobium sp. G106]MBV1687795.1 SDR family oxidoreductase [Novosphingobium sp. G106]
MPATPRRKVLITGASGGMGRACARLFGTTADLVLTDVMAASLEAFSDELRTDGYSAAAHAGDLSDATLLDELVGELRGEQPFVLVHTAGLSPSLADWRSIMQVNLVATELLLQAVEPVLMPGSVAILIASSAGHMMPAVPQVDAVLADPLQPGFLDAIAAVIAGMGGEASPGGMGGLSYTLSKRAVHTLTQRRAIEWGPRGVRVVSISPGMILTPMGRSEIAQTAGAAQVLEAAPVGRGGTAMDIALAAQFLASDSASFISGIDLLVDGGATSAIKAAMASSGPQ